MKNYIRDLITMGADPSKLGRLAHRIQDYLEDGKTIWVKTPAHDWHPATSRELEILNPMPRAIQRARGCQQLALSI